ncbi:MAG: ABC transporter ATP-binding protein [Ruminococcaceae bacterium]|nr:ABC transporter ATP-binding protein [Oscillospiraceae bacterium]
MDGYGRGGMHSDSIKFSEKRPDNLKDYPAFLLRTLKGFFFRLFYVFKLIWDTKPVILVFMTFFSIANGVIPVITAYVTRNIINSLVNAQDNAAFDYRSIALLIISLFAYKFITRSITLLKHMTTRIAGELITKHIKLMIANKTKELDLSSFDDPEFYERLENAQREAGSRPISIINSTFDAASEIISMVSFIAVLATLSPLAPVIIVVLAFPSALINFLFKKKTFLYLRRRSKDRREMNYYSSVLVNKDRAKEIKLLGLTDTFIGKFKTVFTKYYAGIKKLIVREGIWQTTLSVLTLTGNCLLYMYIAYNVWKGDLLVGDWTLYTGALTSVSSAVTALISASSSVYEGTLFIDNLILYMKEGREVVCLAEKKETPTKGIPHKIEFRHVSFKYPGCDNYVLEDVNFTINKGETVVLVGLNGAGKTTLIKLLTRLYDPTGGSILLDGVDIKSFDPDEYYSLFGILFQDFGHYAVSVSENITFGDVHAPVDSDKVRAAAIEGDAHEFIEKLPHGYDTPLTRMFEEEGLELSGGQWQKLSIARAYYKDSDILILDEPTASLDAIAEQDIFNKFDELRKEKTTLFVSHRLSSAVNADSIIVLSGGRITEQGCHNELMENNGQYARMFMAQARRYNEGSHLEIYDPHPYHKERTPRKRHD